MPSTCSIRAICALCRDWQPIPGQDSTGLCPHLSYPNNRTYEHDCCHLKQQSAAPKETATTGGAK